MRSDNEIQTLVGSRDISSYRQNVQYKQPDHEAIYLAVISEQIAIGALWSEQSERLGAHDLLGKWLCRIVV
jgi:hypothetical protein